MPHGDVKRSYRATARFHPFALPCGISPLLFVWLARANHLVKKRTTVTFKEAKTDRRLILFGSSRIFVESEEKTCKLAICRADPVARHLSAASGENNISYKLFCQIASILSGETVDKRKNPFF